jgi:hypothetical protein
MKIGQLVSHLVRSGAACGLVALSLVAAPAQAATIEIAFTGMDLVYNGSAIYDANSIGGGVGDPANGDPLTAVNFSVDGSPVGSLTSNIALDVYIPDVTGIPSAAGTVYNLITPGNSGHFDLLIGTSPLASDYLLVDLSEVSVTYVDVANTVQFNFGAAVSDVFAQNLPFGLVAGEPVTVSFSAQLVSGSRTTSGGFVTGFRASGTGQYNAPVVPEPTTCVLAACGLVALAVRRK